MCDAKLAAFSDRYRLLRLRRKEARIGAGDPGECGWIWPLKSLGLAILLWLRSRRYA